MQLLMGRAEGSPMHDWEAAQELEATWQEALLEALASNASLQALAVAAPSSPIATLQAELKAALGPG